MIIQCRPSSARKSKVTWLSYELTGVRRKTKTEVIKEKEFNTFADANGFANGLIKKGIRRVVIS